MSKTNCLIDAHNNEVSFDFINEQVENILCFGDTINFFGFVKDNGLDIMNMNDNDQIHYLWLLKQVKQGAIVYVVGQQEAENYYRQLFDIIGNLGIKVMWNYIYADNPSNYTKIIQENFSNTIFDYIFVGLTKYNNERSFANILNPIDKLYDMYKTKMYVIATNELWESNLAECYKTTLDRISVKLCKAINYTKADKSVSTLYVFNGYKTKTISAISTTGDEYVLKSLSDEVYFTDYEKRFVKYFEEKNNLEYFWMGFDENTGCTIKQSKYYIKVKNAHNGKLDNSFFDNKSKIIFTENEMLNFILNKHEIFNNGTGICVESYEAAQNLVTALSNPLMRFMLYRTKNTSRIPKESLKLIVDIDWEDPRTVDDKWLLIMLGCPKEEAQEYAEYCKSFVDKNIK